MKYCAAAATAATHGLILDNLEMMVIVQSQLLGQRPGLGMSAEAVSAVFSGSIEKLTLSVQNIFGEQFIKWKAS